ncbi:hypothetical protein GC175_11270 [bacterium]|nr:hypothetical protein [bacterium]
MAFADNFFPVRLTDLYHVNILVLVGLIFIIGAYLTLKNTHGRGVDASHSSLNTIRVYHDYLRVILTLFLFIGIPIRYLVWIPYVFGFGSFIVPGSIAILGNLAILSFVLLLILAYKYNRNYFVLFGILFAFESTIVFLSLSKQAILEVVIILVLAATLIGVRIKQILVVALLVAVIYISFLSPFVTFAREEFRAHGLQSLSDAYIALTEFFGEQTGNGSHSYEAQQWWSRLNYANAQTFSIRAYNLGYQGSTYEQIPYVFIPRILFPGKPALTTGTYFNYLVNGNPDSASSPTVFAEAFWNGGWLYVVLTAIYLGGIYYAFEAYAVKQLTAFRFQYLPIIWMGITMGYRHDGWFVPTFLSAVVIAIVLHFLLTVIFRLLTQSTKLYDESYLLLATTNK